MKKYLKIYGINNLQNIFIHGFIFNDFLKEDNENSYNYIIELNFKKYKNGKKFLEYHSILDINKVYFKDEESLSNFKATIYSNLPIYNDLLEINELIFQEIDNKDLYKCNDDLIKKYKNNYYKNIRIDIKLGLLSSIYYYFSLEKKSIVNLNCIFYILNIQNIENIFEIIYNNLNIFNKENTKEEIQNYKKNHQFNEIGLIFNVLNLFLNGKKFEKRLFDNKDENYLSLFYKIIVEINNKIQTEKENYEYYINSILEKINLDFFEKRCLDSIRNKNIMNIDNLLDYLLVILIKGNFNLILDNIEKFKIKNELVEHVKLICFILKGLLEGYQNLNSEIKIKAFEGKIFDLILNKSSKKLEIKENFIKYHHLIFKNN